MKIFLFSFSFALLYFPVAEPAGAQETVTLADETAWEKPTRKIENLAHFFKTLDEMSYGNTGEKRMFAGVATSVEPAENSRTTVEFELSSDPGADKVPSRRTVRLSLPLADMGQPFVEGQKWSLFFDERGKIVRLQTEGIMTHYRRRTDGFVQVRLRDTEGRVVEVIPTTVMPPESAWEDGFFSYIDLFREAGMVAGHDAVGGAGILELESIALPEIETPRIHGLTPDPSPWRDIKDAGMPKAIPDDQRFAY